MKIVEFIINILRKTKKKEVCEYNCLTIKLPMDMYFSNDDCNINKSTELSKFTEVVHE